MSQKPSWKSRANVVIANQLTSIRLLKKLTLMKLNNMFENNDKVYNDNIEFNNLIINKEELIGGEKRMGESIIEEKDEIKTLKEHLRSDEFKESGLKFAVGSVLIPLLSAVTLFLANWYESNIVDWSVFLVTINVISIPALKAFLKKEFDIEKSVFTDAFNDIEVIYEKKIADIKETHSKEIVDLKDNHNKEVSDLKDEINALKIKVELQKYRIENPNN